MKIYINVPYSEKDKAKALGARWDAVVKRWYYTEKQDALMFEKWFDKSTSVVTETPDSVSLKDFVKQVYGEHHASLTSKAAKAFGVPFPLQSGWLQKYGHRVCRTDRLVFKKKVKARREILTPKDEGAVFKPLCNCAVLPWEDCEHSDALADKAMRDILALG